MTYEVDQGKNYLLLSSVQIIGYGYTSWRYACQNIMFVPVSSFIGEYIFPVVLHMIYLCNYEGKEESNFFT